MNILVFGAGAMGSLFGGLLARDHNVTLVGREEHVRAIAGNGLRVDTEEGSFVTRPEAVTSLPDRSGWDVAAIAVKAYDLAAACDAVASLDRPPRWVLCLQNGYGNEEIVRDRFDVKQIVRGLVYHGACLPQAGRVVWFGRGVMRIGRPLCDRSAPDGELERLALAFTEAGFPTEVTTEVDQEIWKKLAINAAINPLGAITGLPNGELVRSPLLLPLLRASVRETEEVAAAEGGHTLDLVERTMEIALLTGRNRNSMLLDLERGKRTEIDFLNGAIDRLARRHHIPVPVNRTLYALVKGKEEAFRTGREGPC